jgi:hypothetical protein
MRSVPVAATLLVSCALAMAACTSCPDVPVQDRRTQPTQPTSYDTQTLTMVLPTGEAEVGRQAFLDLKCAVCHRVVGEAAFPAPISGTQGPDLDRTLARRPAVDLAAAIVVPSHSISVKTSDDVKRRLEGMFLSPMPDFSRTITIRHLADLLAYLRSLEGTHG